MLKTSRLSALLLVATAFTMPSNDALAKDIVLGASVQLTGPVANTGRYYRDAYQLAIEKINAAGGSRSAMNCTSSHSSSTTTSPTSI